MKKGLVFGKFMPLHHGHLALINFALQHCDHLFIILCYTENEPIEGTIRSRCLQASLDTNSSITLVSFLYDAAELPNTSISSRHVSGLWANAFKTLVPDVDIVFTSEDYGAHVAEFMCIEHILFDKARTTFPVSASEIRANPFNYWHFIAGKAKPWFVKKIALVGSESTGKSVLTERLAKQFNTCFVPEMARDIIEKTNDCTPGDLYKIADLQAQAILSKISVANKLLLVDTDLTITKSYSRYLFGEELIVEPWIEVANKFDLYFFLEPDCEYIQDGTRLSLNDRNALSLHHKTYFEGQGIKLISINGDWDDRFQKMVKTIEQTFFNKKAATTK
jgi:HTH-type transcriptional regulator, transcriptional repressor of NAD biosynthesis genes